MNNSIYKEVEEFAVPLPITQRALAIAQQFASEQPTAEKADRVRWNTLAVLVVNDYFQLLGIETDLESSDSWNPVMRLCADVADLEIVSIGRLECRPLRTSETHCSVPQEVWESRIGYVMVQLDESKRQANLLGFIPEIDREKVTISQLQSPENLIDRLQDLKQTIVSSSGEVRSNRIHLVQWLNESWETGWQAVETLLNSAELTPVMSFRSNDEIDILEAESSTRENVISQAKLIDLGMQVAGCYVVLVVEIARAADEHMEIGLQVHPRNLQYLPSELQLIVLDEVGNVFMEAKSRTADNYIQLQFRGTLGERFSVKVSLGDASITEDFEI
jgi:Protein of unknown function (DUF1822)